MRPYDMNQRGLEERMSNTASRNWPYLRRAEIIAAAVAAVADEIDGVAGGGQIKMVVVIVADQHQANRRQIFKTDARRMDPFGSDPGERAGPVRPDRIGEDVQPLRLDEQGDMADNGLLTQTRSVSARTLEKQKKILTRAMVRIFS